jgi:hypothetical protein
MPPGKMWLGCSRNIVDWLIAFNTRLVRVHVRISSLVSLRAQGQP